MAFDTGQKAVLTTCVLRYKPAIQTSSSSSSSFLSSNIASGGSSNPIPPPSSHPSTSFSPTGPLATPTSTHSSSSYGSNFSGITGGTGGSGSQTVMMHRGEESLIRCCFSFTIRRDGWGIPTMIVGNFIRL